MAKYDKVIPPGQEGKLELVVEGNRVHNRWTKTATIHSNDPDHATMVVTLTGNITPYIEVLPKSRLFLQGHFGEPVSKTITLKSNEDDLDFEITKIESNLDDKLTYTFEPGEEDNTWVIEVHKNPKLARLSTYGTLSVHTNSQRAPEKAIQVQVITQGAITIQPKQVNFGTVKAERSGAPAEPVTRNVMVLKITGGFNIKDLAFSTDEFEGEVEPVEPGKRYNVKVTFNPPEKSLERKTHFGEMTIVTDDPQEPELKVRLVARSM